MRIRVNQTSLYYEIKGVGAPLILLHGNGETHAIFDALAEKLSVSYCVYAVDSRAHGQSDDALLDYAEMAQDVVEFIQLLQLDKPILYGFSDGGIIGLLLAMKHPQILSKLIISGANLCPAGIKRRYVLAMRAVYLFTRNSKFKLMLTQPNIAPEDLCKIKTPTLVLAGSGDVVREAHTKEIAAHIPGASLRILPGESHASYVFDNEKLYEILMPFLS